jgi:hypothetical protein
MGFSRWNSATTLRSSVPYFSVPRGDRFMVTKPEKLPPGPNAYGNIGMLEKTDKLDEHLARKRKQLYMESFKEEKRLPMTESSDPNHVAKS